MEKLNLEALDDKITKHFNKEILSQKIQAGAMNAQSIQFKSMEFWTRWIDEELIVFFEKNNNSRENYTPEV